jgi:hypothetical protein
MYKTQEQQSKAAVLPRGIATSRFFKLGIVLSEREANDAEG